jgi:outer membrane usher protein FimD/PapC
MVNRIIRSNSNHSMGNLHTVNHNLSTVNHNIRSSHSMDNLHMASHSHSMGNRSMLSLNIHSSRNTRSSTRHRVISPSQ